MSTHVATLTCESDYETTLTLSVEPTGELAVCLGEDAIITTREEFGRMVDALYALPDEKEVEHVLRMPRTTPVDEVARVQAAVDDLVRKMTSCPSSRVFGKVHHNARVFGKAHVDAAVRTPRVSGTAYVTEGKNTTLLTADGGDQ